MWRAVRCIPASSVAALYIESGLWVGDRWARVIHNGVLGGCYRLGLCVMVGGSSFRWRRGHPVRVGRVAGALVVVVLAFGGAGCGDDDPPAPSTTSLASPKKGPALTKTETTSPPSGTTPSGTRSATSGDGGAPDLPEAATKNTKAGAEAFAMYYTTQLGEASVTADSSTIRALADKHCDGCDALADQVDLYAKEGVHAPVSPYRNLRLAGSRENLEGERVVEINMDHAEYRLVAPDQKRRYKIPGAKDVTYFVNIGWEGSRWIVRDLVAATP